MAKRKFKQTLRLGLRQKRAREDDEPMGYKTGRKLPGSMNRHKSASIKQHRKDVG